MHKIQIMLSHALLETSSNYDLCLIISLSSWILKNAQYVIKILWQIGKGK